MVRRVGMRQSEVSASGQLPSGRRRARPSASTTSGPRARRNASTTVASAHLAKSPHPHPTPAVAAVHGVDYLLTWNFRHLDNAETKPAIRDTCARRGYAGPEICTPGELMGGLEDGG